MAKQQFYSSILILISGILLLTIMFTGCSSVGVAARWSAYSPRPPKAPKPVMHHSHGVFPKALHIPKGHLPPPGLCRIWYPNLPPGHQPPPRHYAELAGQVPPGTWLISRPSHDRKHVYVTFYDTTYPMVGVFDYKSGRFIREKINRRY